MTAQTTTAVPLARGRGRRTRRLIGLAVLLGGMIIGALIVGGGTPDTSGTTTPALLGTVPLADPVSVAIGAQESLYVVDGTTIVHFSATGRLLGRVGHTHAPLAADATGHLTFAAAGQVVTAGRDGTVLQRWPAGDVQALAVGRHGEVYVASAVDGGSAGSVWRVRRFSAAGRLLSAWPTPYAETLAVGGNGAVYGIGGGDLVQMDGRSGRVLRRWVGSAAQGTTSFDAVAADGRGTIYVGVTESGAAPFAIERLQAGRTGRGFVTVNTAQELVAGLAIDGQGHIYVIRSSYARPCPSNVGLDKLAPTGRVLGTFRQPCAG